jgi:hypothetical protein
MRKSSYNISPGSRPLLPASTKCSRVTTLVREAWKDADFLRRGEFCKAHATAASFSMETFASSTRPVRRRAEISRTLHPGRDRWAVFFPLCRWASLCPIIYNALESYKHVVGYHRPVQHSEHLRYSDSDAASR